MSNARGVAMDLQKMITELEAERDRLDKAILALERLSRAESDPGKRARARKLARDMVDLANMPDGVPQSARK